MDLSVAAMDDYSVVLGMELFDQVRAFLVPCSNSMCIMYGLKACVEPTERTTRPTTKALLAL